MAWLAILLSILAIALAAWTAWINFHGLRQVQETRHATAAERRLHAAERLLHLLGQLQDRQGRFAEVDFQDVQMSMRAELALNGLHLPVTTILSRRSYDVEAGRGKPGWAAFVAAVDGAREEIFSLMGRLSLHPGPG
jgi:hypothetical protein